MGSAWYRVTYPDGDSYIAEDVYEFVWHIAYSVPSTYISDVVTSLVLQRNVLFPMERAIELAIELVSEALEQEYAGVLGDYPRE